MKMTRIEWRCVCIEVQRLAKTGSFIYGIKLLRNRTGCGLKEAFDAVKRLQAAEDLKAV